MKVSYLLQTASRVLAPMQIVFSIFLLLRGHNDPGGGFAAGLLVVAALGLLALGSNAAYARRVLRIDPVRLGGIGLSLAITSGVIGLLSGDEFLTGEWVALEFAGLQLDIGTPLLFDVGVYLLVIGIATAVLFGLMSSEEDDSWS